MAQRKLVDASNVIYALTSDGQNYRYVGYTAASLRKRMLRHRWEARHGSDRPPYLWMRESGIGDVAAVVLEKLPAEATTADLGRREAYWIERLRREGHDLLNITKGGLGAPGYRHPPELIARISAKAGATRRGRPLSVEHRAALAAARTGVPRGPYNWADVSKQAESGGRAAHNRWHVARGIVKDGCTYCT